MATMKEGGGRKDGRMNGRKGGQEKREGKGKGKKKAPKTRMYARERFLVAVFHDPFSVLRTDTDGTNPSVARCVADAMI